MGSAPLIFDRERQEAMKVIITGASKGIGRGIALVLGNAGHTVGLLARTRGALEDVQKKIAASGGRAIIGACNLRSHAQTTSAIDYLMSEMKGVDALINNAGLVIRKDIFEITPDEWHAMVETNINGPFYATQEVVRTMKEQGSGHIVNISSISGKFPLKGGSGYAATKFAMTGFSQSLFQEVRDYGIKVTTIYPGSVDTRAEGYDPGADTSWKVRPEEVGQACLEILQTAPGNCISEVEIRPLGRPK